MGLIIYKNGRGEIRPTWWGRVTYRGKAHETNLNVPIRGRVPVDADGNVVLSAKGDDAFEQSRRAANKVLEAWRKETRTDKAELQKKAYETQTGVSLDGVPFSKLIEKWQGVMRTRPPTKERVRNAKVTFDRFAKFARAYAEEQGRRAETLNDVTSAMVQAWFREISNVYAWATVRDMMHLMSGAFRRWSTNGQSNPFAEIVLRGSKEQGEEKRRTERKALTPEQFDRLLSCAKEEDERLYQLIVTCAFTGLRVGDACHLKVADVDLDADTITCVTSKTGQRVRIPILDNLLREVLTERCAIPADGSRPTQYVFPWAAIQYDTNRTSIIRSVKPVFARAVFGDELDVEDAKLIDDQTVDVTGDITEAVQKTDFTEQKRKRVIEVYNRFKQGQMSHQIAEAMGIARGQVSNYLKDAERLTGEALRPRAKKNGKITKVDLLEKTRVERKIGRYAASTWGWHNLRHHFVTCALNRGVPIHKIAAIVGHGTTQTTASYADTETITEPMRTQTAPAALPVTQTPLATNGNDAMVQAMAAMMAAMTPDQKKAMMTMIAQSGK